MVNESWDTFGLFDTLLSDFVNLLDRARDVTIADMDAELAVKVAVVGFGQFCPFSQLDKYHLEFVATRLQGELSLENLAWYEEYAEAIAVFGCLAIGALLGKFQAGEIDDSGFMLGEAHLPSFLSLNSDDIDRCYLAFINSPL